MDIKKSLKQHDKDKVMIDIVKLLEVPAEPDSFLHKLQEHIAEEAAVVFNTEIFNLHSIIYYMHLARQDIYNKNKKYE